MARMLIFGMGYAARHLADRLRARGWEVAGTTRDGRNDSLAFDDAGAVLGYAFNTNQPLYHFIRRDGQMTEIVIPSTTNTFAAK